MSIKSYEITNERKRKEKLAEKKRNAETNAGGDFLSGAGYVAGKIGLGLGGVLEGAVDLVSAGGHLLVGDKEGAEDQFKNNVMGNLGEELDAWYNPNGAMQYVGDVGSGIGQSSVFLLDTVFPGLGTTLFFAGTAGSNTSAAAAQTGKVGLSELAYGASSAALETVVDKAVHGAGTSATKLLKGAMGKSATKAMTSVGKSAVKAGFKNILKETAKSAAGEFAEEALSEAIDPVLQRATKVNPYAEAASLSDILYAGAVGAGSGGLMGGGASAINFSQTNKRGRVIRESGKSNALIRRAELVAHTLSAAKDGYDTKAQQDGVGRIEKTKYRKESKRTQKHVENLLASVNKYKSLADDTINNGGSDALLGEIQNNTYFAAVSAEIDLYEQLARSMSDEAVTEFLDEINTDGRSYTIEDFRTNRDLIATEYATAMVVERIRVQNDSARSFDTPASQTAQDDTLVGGVENDVAAIRAEAKALGVDESYAELAVKAYEVGGLRDLSAADFTRSFISAVRMAENGATSENLLKVDSIARLDNSALAFAAESGRKIAANKKASVGTEGSKAKFSLEGYAEDGKKIYRSNFPKGTPKAAKSERILQYIKDVWSKKPIPLVISNGDTSRTIYAQFDPTLDEKRLEPSDASKLAGGNRHGTHSEQRVTLDLADDYYDIASSATYNYSKLETGKDSNTHKDVIMWHYFVEDIYFSEYDGSGRTPYTVTINVKEKANGDFVYSFNAEKESSTRRTLHADVITRKGNNGELFLEDSIPQKPSVVKPSDTKSIRRASQTGKAGVILADGLRASKDFNDRQYAVYKAAELMAKALGTDIVFHRSMTHAGKTAAGYFDPSDGSIHININAMRDGKHIALYTLGHEAVHFIKAWSPGKYTELESFVMEKLGDRAEALMADKRAQLDEMGDLKDLTDTEADALVREEVVADSMEGVLSDGEVLAELQQRNSTLWEKIKTFVTSVIQRVKAAYGDLSGVSKTAQVLSETVESLDQVKRLFTESVVDASEARKSAQAEGVTGVNEGNGQVRASIVENVTLNTGAKIDTAVLLDTSFFNGLSPRNWGAKLKSFVTNRSQNNPFIMTVLDENGAEQKIVFARTSDRVSKDGGASHPVLGELLNTKDNISKLSVIHIDEIMEVSEENNPYYTGDSNHGWLDENGWLHRNAYVINAINGDVFRITIDIAKTRDGRAIMYATKGKIERVGQSKVGSLKKRGPKTHSNSNGSVPQNGGSVNPSAKNSQQKNFGNTGTKESHSAGGDITEGPFAAAERRTGEQNADPEAQGMDMVEDSTSEAKQDVVDAERELTDRDVMLYLAETMARTDADYEIVKNYRDQKGTQDARYDKAKALSKRIDALQATLYKDPDPAKRSEAAKTLRGLYQEISALNEEIAATDRELARIEGLKAIRNLLKRERKNAENYYRELFQRREKAKSDQRQMTETDRKTRRVIGRVNTMFLNPTKTKHVPADLREAIETVLNRDIPDFRELRNNLRKMAKMETDIEQLEREPVLTPEKESYLKYLLKAYGELEGDALAPLEQARALFEAFEDYEKKAHPTSFDQGLLDKLNGYLKDMAKENKPLSQMSMEAQQAVFDFYSTLYHRINTENKLFKEQQAVEIEGEARKVMQEMIDSKTPAWVTPKPGELAIISNAREYLWKLLKPINFFDMLGSDTFSRAFMDLHRGMGTWARDIVEAKDRFQEISKKYGYDKWDLNTRFEIESSNGKRVSVSLGQIMSIYAYSKRENALAHFEFGGFTFAPNATYKGKYGDPKGIEKFAQLLDRSINDSQRYTLDAAAFGKIISKLSDEQKAFVDEMQSYLSVELAAKGNSVSRVLYDMELFGEHSYFPMKVAREYIASQTGRIGDPKTKNKGMTKQVKPDAKEALILGDFMEVWNGHVNDMALYHGTVLPMENMNRLLDWKPGSGMSGAEGQSERIVISADSELAKRLRTSTRSKYSVIRDYLVERFYGKEFTLSDGTTAIMDKRDAQELSHLADDLKVAELSNLAELIEKAKFDHQADKVTHSKFDAFRYYAVTVEFEGQAYDLLLNVGRARNNQSYHIYDITKNRGAANRSSTDLSRPVGNAMTNSPSDSSISQNTQKSNTQSQNSSGIEQYASMKELIRAKYGHHAVEYIEQLLRDMNGGVMSAAPMTLMDKGISLFKKSAVMASWSVIIQQPSSIARAFAYVDKKYFLHTKGFDFKNSREMYEELKRYAPVAIIKEMGGFDTGVGQSTADYITEKEYKGLGKKLGGLRKDKAYRDNALGYGAAKADEMTWIHLWEAVKRETADKHPDLKVGSEEFLQKAGERFEDVVIRTQVYDSTLSRNAMMRSKDTGWKMATAFMAEPTTVVNMLISGSVALQRGNAKFFRRTVGSVIGALILNAVLASIVYAARDDDEEKNYGEKYLSSLTEELADSFNPLSTLPYLKDIMSLVQGYEVERSDMAVYADLINAINGMGSSEKSWFEKSMNLVANVGTLFGLPTRNIYRDARGIHNVFTNAGGDGTTAAGAKYAVKESAVSMIPFGKAMGIDAGTSNGYQLYDAMVAGDEAHIKRVKARFESETKANAALRTALRDKDARIRQAAMARYEGDMATYSSLVREVKAEGIFSQDLIVTAVNAEMNAIKKDYESGAEDNADPDAVDEAAVEGALYTSADLNGQLEAGDYAEAKVIITDMVNAKMAAGKTKKQAQALVKSGVTRYWKEKYLAAYKAKNATECKRIRAILKQTGLYGTTAEILEVTQGWVKDSTKKS